MVALQGGPQTAREPYRGGRELTCGMAAVAARPALPLRAGLAQAHGRCGKARSERGLADGHFALSGDLH